MPILTVQTTKMNEFQKVFIVARVSNVASFNTTEFDNEQILAKYTALCLQ